MFLKFARSGVIDQLLPVIVEVVPSKLMIEEVPSGLVVPSCRAPSSVKLTAPASNSLPFASVSFGFQSRASPNWIYLLICAPMPR